MSLRTLPSWAFTALAVAPVLVVFLLPLPDDSSVRLALTIAFIAWVICFSMIAWLRLDEAGREAHKFAWFWGGASGLLVAQCVAFGALSVPAISDTITAIAERFTPGAATAQAGFVVGIFAASGIMAVCYLSIWAGWWLYRRSGR